LAQPPAQPHPAQVEYSPVSVLVQKNIGVVEGIVSRLKRRYAWVAGEDLHSYAFLGLMQAASLFQADRGVPFVRFAAKKGMFLALDQMRKDGVVRRRDAKPRPRHVSLSWWTSAGSPVSGDLVDRRADICRRRIERRELCQLLLNGLSDTDRQLLIMYYHEQMTFREVAEVLGTSAPAICQRHKTIIRRLRRLAASLRLT